MAMSDLILGVDTSKRNQQAQRGNLTGSYSSGMETIKPRTTGVVGQSPTSVSPTSNPMDPAKVAAIQSEYERRQADKRRLAFVNQGFNFTGSNLTGNPLGLLGASGLSKKTLLGAS